MKLLTIALVTVCAAVWVSIAPVSAAASCESLSALKLPDTTITLAQSVAPGAFSPPTPPPPGGGGQAYTTLPAFCRVAATITPTSDSDIKVEVWLPASGWNGKYQAVGNGGWAGTISYGAMARALRDGYATSSTDTGHTGGNASFALGHPEKLVDYAYRAVHEMTVKSKAIANAFYGADATRSYFNGCSTGGRQALIAAQRFPNDFDGIVAGAAANPKSGLDAWRIWMTQAMLKDKASFIPEEKHRVIHQAVLDACDGLDGVKDGLIENPTRCRFDPAVLACRGADGPNCLTAAQVETAKVVMSPVKHRQTGELIFPGFEPGTELGWSRMLSGPDPYANALEQFRYIVFKDPKWDWRTFNLERDLAAAEKIGQGTLAAVDPNLTAFAQHGGKLITYHGWSDNSIAPQASVNFYTRALAATKAPTRESTWLRLYMVPGMGHCSGGEGPDTFDMMSALDAWVDKGTLPQQIEASKITAGKVTRTRPLCPYPQVARYKGTGSIDQAANFACVAPLSVAPPKPGQPGKDVVWVPTPTELVEKMLDMAEVAPNDFVMDLGSGDGRNVIAAAKRGARALGVEYNPDLVELSRQRAVDAHVSDKATFVQGDMYAADVSQATVLALFLTPEVLDRMTAKFLAMRPGTRIVLNTFPITDWEPDATDTIGAPCKAWCTAVMVIVPARVEGTWQSGSTHMTLRQDYQFVRGTLDGQQVTGRLRGARITLTSANTEYSGEVFADRIEGTAAEEGRQRPWIAVRSQPPSVTK